MKGLLFAGALGYLVGTLWAPRKGALLRAEILQHFEKMQNDGTEFLQDNMKEGQQLVSDAVDKGHEWQKSATRKLSTASAAVARAGGIAGESFESLGGEISDIADKSKNIFSADGNGHDSGITGSTGSNNKDS